MSSCCCPSAIPNVASSSVMRSPVRTQLAGPPGDPKRWNKFDALTTNYLKLGVPLDVVLEGTPQWAAISQERWNGVGVTYRRRAVPPQNDAYCDILTHYVQTFGDRIARYEVWNEANSPIIVLARLLASGCSKYSV